MRGSITYRVRNAHDAPIPDVHLMMLQDEALVGVDLGVDAELVHHDAEVGYRIYRTALTLVTPAVPSGRAPSLTPS